ncbi:MAG TPA: peptidoglycan-binding domain-containing protein [Kofleriaceae bacterium]|nr:peptidoglycan-binding domain-containing protein [Kofleriaceae bacterium]
MTGPDVLDVQTKLKATGYAVGNLDSEFGPTTDAAVRAFQRDHRLEVDGVVGPNTLAALTAAASGGSGTAKLPRPCTVAEAIARARSMINKGGQYQLGTGDYRPRTVDNVMVDEPWTTSNSGAPGSDCAGFALSWCYKIPRHRPGFNSGSWATVSDDLNCNSAIEDADHARDLFVRATGPVVPGDLVTYPTITLPDHPGMQWIGHVGIVIGVDRAGGFDLARPDYSLLDIAQCHGPNGRSPAVTSGDGSVWNQHDHQWPKPQHRTVVLRAKP